MSSPHADVPDPGAPVPTSGQAVIDLDELESVAQLPLEAHMAVYERLHASLRDALAAMSQPTSGASR